MDTYARLNWGVRTSSYQQTVDRYLNCYIEVMSAEQVEPSRFDSVEAGKDTI